MRSACSRCRTDVRWHPWRQRAITNAPVTAIPVRTPAVWGPIRRRRNFPDDLYDRVRELILAPVLRGLQAEGETYIGILYCGLMWTADGPKVIEFNVRFGDPETQVLMPRVRGDFAGTVTIRCRRCEWTCHWRRFRIRAARGSCSQLPIIRIAARRCTGFRLICRCPTIVTCFGAHRRGTAKA